MTEDDKLLREFNELLMYDPDTGEFRWKRSRRGAAKGGLVGCKTPDGYMHGKILFKQYQLHRLAWFMVYHRWPTVLDHINGDRADNRIANLREVSQRVNMQNTTRHRNGRLVGATYLRKSDTWLSVIRINRKTKYLGTYRTEQDAHTAYLLALEQISE
jgi:hypothetical protein